MSTRLSLSVSALSLSLPPPPSLSLSICIHDTMGVGLSLLACHTPCHYHSHLGHSATPWTIYTASASLLDIASSLILVSLCAFSASCSASHLHLASSCSLASLPLLLSFTACALSGHSAVRLASAWPLCVHALNTYNVITFLKRDCIHTYIVKHNRCLHN